MQIKTKSPFFAVHNLMGIIKSFTEFGQECPMRRYIFTQIKVTSQNTGDRLLMQARPFGKSLDLLLSVLHLTGVD